MHLTGIPELDQMVMLDLDYPSLTSICRADTYLNQLCDDDIFWKQKFIRDFGEYIQPHPTNYSHRRYYDQYYRILNMIESMLDQLIQNRGHLNLKEDEVEISTIALWGKACHTQIIFSMHGGVMEIFIVKEYVNDQVIEINQLPTGQELLNLFLSECGSFPNEPLLIMDKTNRDEHL